MAHLQLSSNMFSQFIDPRAFQVLLACFVLAKTWWTRATGREARFNGKDYARRFEDTLWAALKFQKRPINSDEPESRVRRII